TPAAGAVEHRVYHGHDHDAVAVASPDSRVYLGSTRDASFALNNVRHLGDHFWRVDSVDAQGRVTPGRVWRFRPRRLAFPGAEGYGRFAAGGRGGRVYTVTSLADRGPGTLREAVEAEGPRTVVFAVSGLITLESRLTVRNPYLTIAGQTAPGKGITVRGYNLGLLGARDVVIRHLRVRPGDIAGVTLDGMGMASSDHSIIDHASISWSIDEAFSSRGARNITLQRTLISEALNVAGHKKYRPGTMHGYAASISGHVGSFHHNLLAHNSGRNWSLAGGLNNLTQHAGWLDIRNNVVYNWHNRTTDGGAAKVNFVANYYRPGPATKVFHLLKPERNNIAGFGPQDYYVEGNVMEGHVGPNDALGGVLEPEPYENFIVDRPFFESHVTTHSARAAFKIVLSDVGCTQPMLDEHDRRVIRETLDGTVTYHGSRSGLPGLPDSQTDVGGWEDYPEERRSADWDTDSDGLPDWWERIHNLNTSSAPGDFSEANADRDGDAYTNLEEYLNWIAAPHRHVAPGATIEIDLREYARGFTAAPVFSIERAAPGAAILAPDGRTLRYTAPTGSAGLAEIVFTVRDAEGDVMTRTIGAAVH
ncbi:MAG TPA: hypothetical protein VHF69_06340, partial [Candidatus Synoicihabitans sp.]|nr:hypothetical protein [Candidatus Synoicihabitans sp.]